MYSFVGDIVIDPFSGLGTTAQAAALTHRISVCFEIEPAYYREAQRRFAEFQNRIPRLFLRDERSHYDSFIQKLCDEYTARFG